MIKSIKAKFFSIQESANATEWSGVSAARRWGLPGVKCPACGSIWGESGSEYPSIELPDFEENPIFRNPQCVPLSVFNRLKDALVEKLPPGTPISPGTAFGPLVGKCGRKPTGFAWVMPWQLLIRDEALSILRRAGLNLPGMVKPILKFRSEPIELWEFDIRSHSRLLNGVYHVGEIKFCPTCLRDSAVMPGTPLIELDSIPADVDLFRVSNFQTLLIVSERFAEAVRTAGIKGAEFRVVDVLSGEIP